MYYNGMFRTYIFVDLKISSTQPIMSTTGLIISSAEILFCTTMLSTQIEILRAGDIICSTHDNIMSVLDNIF